ncbi:MAG: type II/IV secretion system ATPase subunit, partial [Thermoplasmata archaeon]
MAGEAAPVPEETEAPSPSERKKATSSPWLRLGASLRKNSSDPRPVKLARLGVSGQGSEGEVTPVPPLDDPGLKELDLAPIRTGFSYVRITYHNTRNEYLYEVIEPPLSPIEPDLTDRLRIVLVDAFEPLPETDPETKRRELRKMVDAKLQEWELGPGPTTKGRILYHLERDFIGYGIVDVPMTDTEVEDISCDGVGIPLYIYHRKYGSIRSNLKFHSSKQLDDYVIWLAQRSGKHISVASPILDATVPDGSRLQATLGTHVTKRGSSFTIRRFRDNPFTPVDLLKFKTMSPEMMAYLWIAIENGQSMMVCGGTASGKTTTLNATLLFIPPQMKIVSIEDTRELNLPHENWVPSLTRAGFGAKNLTSGKAPGEIDMFDLLAAALRQRPQYLMVGEVRGAEAFIVFQAMATGKTCYTTFHAESVSAMVHRMENPPITLPRSLVSALNLVLLQRQVKVGTKMTRRVQSLTEIVGLDPETNELITNSVYSWNPADDTFLYSGHSYVYERVALMKNLSMKEMEREVRNRAEMMDYLLFRDAQATRLKPFTHRDVGQLVAFYYK